MGGAGRRNRSRAGRSANAALRRLAGPRLLAFGVEAVGKFGNDHAAEHEAADLAELGYRKGSRDFACGLGNASLAVGSERCSAHSLERCNASSKAKG